MNKKNVSLFLVVVLFFTTIVSSCKKTYNEPAEPTDSIGLTANISIKDLKAKHTKADGSYNLLDSNYIISGVVIGNDISGNIYKDLYIRGDDGYALDVQLASTGLYVNYPVGRRVFIKCKGMYITDYNGIISIGLKSNSNGIITIEGIPEPLITNYVIGGSLGNDASPMVVTEADLTALSSSTGAVAMQNKLVGNLIQLKDYEFALGSTKRTFGDTTFYHTSTTKGFTYIKQCSSTNSYIISTSGYSSFVAAYPPKGNGNVTAICTIYGSTPQLVLRSLNDLDLKNGRCNLYEEDFGGLPISTNCLSMAGWQNIKEEGNKCYYVSNLGSSGAYTYAVVSAYVSGSNTALTTNVTSWLITPGIDIPANITPKLTTRTASNGSASSFKVLVSTDYNGTSQTPSTATWLELATFPNANSFAWTVTSNLDLSAYVGKKIYLAFKYFTPAGTIEKSACTSELDEFKITRN